MSATRQHEQEAHDRSEVAVAAATAQSQADMLHELLRIEQQVAGNTVSNQQIETHLQNFDTVMK